MYTPNKIYIAVYPNDDGLDTHLGDWYSEPEFHAEDNLEYVRKDALMNYFHKRVEELNSPLNGVFGSTEREHCNERISELLLLIDKLNSM